MWGDHSFIGGFWLSTPQILYFEDSGSGCPLWEEWSLAESMPPRLGDRGDLSDTGTSLQPHIGNFRVLMATLGAVLCDFVAMPDIGEWIPVSFKYQAPGGHAPCYPSQDGRDNHFFIHEHSER